MKEHKLKVNKCLYCGSFRIDPRTDKVTTISYTNNAKNKWQGGVLSPKDGCIYAIPSNELHVLRIDTNYSESDQYQQISLIGPLPKKKDKWQGKKRFVTYIERSKMLGRRSLTNLSL